MIWIKRKFDHSPLGESAVQNVFETLYLAHGERKEMLMIAQNHAPLISTVWLRVPEKLVSAFPEFEPGKEEELPKRASLIMGEAGEFEKRFNYGDDY